MVEFEWDSSKATSNFRKHRVSFVEAGTIFYDPLGITIFDPQHSDQEDRYITIGVSTAGRVLMVAHTDRDERIRIITARELTRRERKDYEDEIQKRNG
jgi:uncharacterized DUF497 family protein